MKLNTVSRMDIIKPRIFLYLSNRNLETAKEKNLNRPITSMETKSVIKNLPTNKSAGTEVFTGEF